MFLNGRSVALNVSEAALHFHAAAESGDLSACVQLAFLYMHGLGVEKDAVTAADFLRAPLLAAHATAEHLAALLLLEAGGEPFVAAPGVLPALSSALLAARTEGLAADDARGRAAAAVAVAVLLPQQQAGSAAAPSVPIPSPHAVAAALLTHAAGKGVHEASYGLGMMHLKGVAVGGRDLRKAVALLSTASEGGVAAASFALAKLYATGAGVKQDCRVAFALLQATLSRASPPAPAPLPAAWERLTRAPQPDAAGALLHYLRGGLMGWEVASWNAAHLLEEGLLEGTAATAAPTAIAAALRRAVENDASDAAEALAGLGGGAGGL